MACLFSGSFKRRSTAFLCSAHEACLLWGIPRQWFRLPANMWRPASAASSTSVATMPSESPPVVLCQVSEALEKFYGAEFLEQHWETHAVPRGTPTEGKDEMHDPDSFGCGAFSDKS